MNNALPVHCRDHAELIAEHLADVCRVFGSMNEMNGPSGDSWCKFFARQLAGRSLESLTIAEVRKLHSQWRTRTNEAFASGGDLWEACLFAASEEATFSSWRTSRGVSSPAIHDVEFP